MIETPLLNAIHTPADVKGLAENQLAPLAQELRARIIHTVSHTGGHLAPSLGTIELTLALCRVFNFPHDKLVWDVGHQCYAWKLLTGRADRFDTLRQYEGLRGFPSPSESPYDAFIGGHAGVALSAALGMAAARDQRKSDEHIIAVVGDGALTNGISLEALNAIHHTTQRLILIINDNGMSISRNVGAFSRLLARQLSTLRYNRLRAAAEAAGHQLHLGFMYTLYHRLKALVKPLLLRHRAAIFEDLGVRYLGPIDGHDIPALTEALQSAAEGHVPVVLHIATVKGKGFTPAELHPSKWHGVSPWSNKPAQTVTPSLDWSHHFGESLISLARHNPKIIALTAAMRDGTGLTRFFSLFPQRSYDVGICEAHAVAFAAGLAAAGYHPVVALYATFAQRAVDNFFHEVCLQSLPFVLCLDRAGIVGADGPTHHGLYDLAMFRALPNIQLLAPSTPQELNAMLTYALSVQGPVVIRYPRGVPQALLESVPCAPICKGKAQLLRPSQGKGVIWALGDTLALAERMARQFGLGLVNARFVVPLDVMLLDTFANEPIITFENAALTGGFGEAVGAYHRGPLLRFGWPEGIIPQGTTTQLQQLCELDEAHVLQRIEAFIHG